MVITPLQPPDPIATTYELHLLDNNQPTPNPPPSKSETNLSTYAPLRHFFANCSKRKEKVALLGILQFYAVKFDVLKFYEEKNLEKENYPWIVQNTACAFSCAFLNFLCVLKFWGEKILTHWRQWNSLDWTTLRCLNPCSSKLHWVQSSKICIHDSHFFKGSCTLCGKSGMTNSLVALILAAFRFAYQGFPLGGMTRCSRRKVLHRSCLGNAVVSWVLPAFKGQQVMEWLLWLLLEKQLSWLYTVKSKCEKGSTAPKQSLDLPSNSK